MTLVKVKCPSCDGNGVLPPLGDKGDPKDVTRYFPRPCDACNCSRYVYIEKQIQEKSEDEGYVTPQPQQGYTAGQGDC